MLAQANRATITGAITDSSGAVIPNAEVKAANDGTKVATKTVSNDRGIYSLLNLPPGTYTITAKRDGFKTVDFPSVTLIVDQVVELEHYPYRRSHRGTSYGHHRRAHSGPRDFDHRNQYEW